MQKTKSIKLNFIMNVLLTVSSVIFPLISFPYVSRILQPVGTGKVSFATELVAYFNLFAQLGIPTYGIHVCAKIRDDREALTKTAHELLIINLIMSVVSYAALALTILFVPRVHEERLLFVIISSTLFLSAIGMDWLYKALEQYTYITVRSLVFKAVALIAMFLLIHSESDYVLYGAITIFAASASNILNFINVHKYISLKPTGGYRFKRHLKPVLIFFAMACATTIYTHVDTVMLGFLTTDADVGYYNAAVRVKTILAAVVTSLGTVLLPRISYYMEKGMKEEFQRVTKKAFHFVWLLAVPLTLYFMLYAEESIRFLVHDAYIPSIVPMQIIMPTLLIIGLSNITGIQILVPSGREKTVLYSEIAGASTDILLNFILIPVMQARGAAIGTLIAELVVLSIQLFAVRKEIVEAVRSIAYWKIAVSIIGAVAGSLFVKWLPVSFFVKVLLSGVTFFGLYLLILMLCRESFLTEIFGQFRSFIKKGAEKKRL